MFRAFYRTIDITVLVLFYDDFQFVNCLFVMCNFSQFTYSDPDISLELTNTMLVFCITVW